jgi:hypothetical protein
MQLRPYQQAAVDAVYNHLRDRDDNPCVVIPTAGGKTPCMATICKDAVTLWQGRVLVLAHVKELLQQTADKLTAVCPEVDFGIYSAGLKRRDTSNAVIIAGIQSIYKRACELDRFDLIIVDEGHLIPVDGEGMYQQFLTDAKKVNPHLRIIGLAHSAAGKDWPRKLNTRILFEIGAAGCLGERFSSGEGVQDALYLSPSMLFQTDEIDGILQSMNRSKDGRYESLMSTLLTMYSTANSVYPMRRKAGKEAPGAIDQPSLVVYGTAIPNHYYEALSERMLTNGFFARMIILECGERGSGQEPKVLDIPERVIATARWWNDYKPGTGNLQSWHPIPTIVTQDEEGRDVLVEARLEAEREYNRAERKNDPVGTTVWGRVSEQMRKLALLYAISENHREPVITKSAAEWAARFVTHQVRRMLFMAGNHVAENSYHADCLRLIRKLQETPERQLPHSLLLKRMKMDAKSFQEMITTLEQQGDIATSIVATTGRPQRMYKLIRSM